MSATSEELAKLVRETHAMVCEIRSKMDGRAASPATSAIEAAPDGELDSKHADFVVEKDPKQWTGDSFAGCRLSETTGDYCRAVAGLKQWKGNKEKREGKTYTNKRGEIAQSCDYSFKQAAWALGWAARLDAGYRASEAATSDETPAEDDSSIPF